MDRRLTLVGPKGWTTWGWQPGASFFGSLDGETCFVRRLGNYDSMEHAVSVKTHNCTEFALLREANPLSEKHVARWKPLSIFLLKRSLKMTSITGEKTFRIGSKVKVFAMNI